MKSLCETYAFICKTLYSACFKTLQEDKSRLDKEYDMYDSKV